MPGYINILQGKIARYEEQTTPSNVLGFYTDGITTCSFLVFTGKKDGKRRISALHSDGNLFNNNPELILAEKNWVGELEGCYLYRDPKNDLDSPHPLIAFANKNKFQMIQNNFDSTNENYSELDISFDIKEKDGFKFNVYAHDDFPYPLLNHPQAEKVYTYYKLNVQIQELHSNILFNALCLKNPNLSSQWNAKQLTFADRSRMTTDDASAVEHQHILFDGVVFTKPGKHDLMLTPYATGFFEKYKGIDLKSDELQKFTTKIYNTGIILSPPLSKEQVAIIKLMQVHDQSLIITQGPALEGLINQSYMISSLYQYVNSNFDANAIADKYIRSLVYRYRKTASVLGSEGAAYFNQGKFSEASLRFSDALENALLSFPHDSLEMGTAHHNMGAVCYEEYITELNPALLAKAKHHLTIAFDIRTKIKDKAAQKTKERLDKIEQESIRFAHVVKQPAFLEKADINNKLEINGGNAYFYLSPASPIMGHSTLTTQMIELYGRYASRYTKLERPIFSNKDYETNNVRYFAFFIGDGETGSKGISTIALYDNYETPAKNEMKLRFVWHTKLLKTTDHYSIEPKYNGLNQAVANTLKKYDFTLCKNSAVMNEEIYVCGFTTLFMNTTYQDLEQNTYPLDPEHCILHSVSPQLLIPTDWQEKKGLCNPSGQPLLGNEYECFKLSGPQSKSILAIVNQNAVFLKKEEGYDYKYTLDEKNIAQHDIYVITNASRTLCLGVFTFFRKEMKPVYKDMKRIQNVYTFKREEKKLSNEAMLPFLQNKFTKNEAKENAAELNTKNKSNTTLGMYRHQMDPVVQKYRGKRADYQDLLFYWRSKTKIDEKLESKDIGCYQMQVAYMHQFYRRKGIMKKLWPIFQEQYGTFLIDSPSDAMRSFIDDQKINKAGHGWGQALWLG